MSYQDTAAASKANAFCWRTWEPQVQWKQRAQDAGMQRTRHIEAKRAAGVDPLFIAGMGSSIKQNPMTAVRFALAEIARKGPRRG